RPSSRRRCGRPGTRAARPPPWSPRPAGSTRGARFSLGYGACPNLEDRAKIADLLQPERIGVHLSEEFQLHPEQSTDAIVIHHPEAKYFNAR
ncbi:vitamin B12 dependent-methionine synthase activation domain-containing protein, partial [Streptomyces sp. NPDC005921]